MHTFYFSLAYLLTKHECVIVPGFGAFIVYPSISKEQPDSGIMFPPKNLLGFNPAIKHNDGLLANTISKVNDTSYNEACALIYQLTDKIKLDLKENKIVEFPWIGSFQLSKGDKTVFKPSTQLSCNAEFFGFTNFYISPLSEMQNLDKTAKKGKRFLFNPFRKKPLTYTGYVAASLIALFLIASPMNNDSEKTSTQNAAAIGFPSLSKTNTGSINSVKSTKNNILSNTQLKVNPNLSKIKEGNELELFEKNSIDSFEAETILGEKDTVLASIDPKTNSEIKSVVEGKIDNKKVSDHYYYIVIASLPSRESAEKTLQRFQNGDFEDAAIVSEGDKHRIYVHRLDDKTKAENYLREFRKTNPKYSKAWLLTQSN